MKIVYWATCCLEPEIEAVSKEVALLAGHFRPSFIFSINSQVSFRLSLKDRSIGFHSNCDPWIRPAIRAMEAFADISHVYGDITPWPYWKSLGRKPLVHTIASERGTPIAGFLDRCAAVIVQTQGMRRKLSDLGYPDTKVHLVYPGVNLAEFRPTTDIQPLNIPRILFATAPRSSEELEARGVFLLMEAAKDNPGMNVTLLFRPWSRGYTSIDVVRQRLHSESLTNVVIRDEAVTDMADIYRAHHFTSIPYTRADGGKECPNSLVESLACGVPVLVTDVSPIADFVEQHECGIVHPPTHGGLLAAVEEGLTQYQLLSLRARAVADSHFKLQNQIHFLERLYFSLV